MEEFKGTEGNWFASGIEIVSMPSQCKISNSISGWNYEQAIANANLISAAPDLLKELVELRKWVVNLKDWKGVDPPIELRSKAIDKALKLT